MNRVAWMLVVAILLALTFESAQGQVPVSPAGSPAASGAAAPAAGETSGNPSVPAPAAAAAEAAPADAAPAEGPKPWTIPQPCLFQQLGIKTGGWIQQGITFDSRDPVDRFNGPIATNDRSGEYMLNQAWLYFLRPTKTDGCGFDVGGRVDLSYGEDWRFGQCFGLENRIDSANSYYGLILPQFYLEVAYNDLTVKVGHFATLTSLEVVPAPLNFFYSHSYLMSGYFDPLLVTGAQADYKLSDNWTVAGGFNRGWLMFENPFDTLNFLGGFKWASDDKRSALSVMVDSGPTVTFTGFHDQTSVIMVYTHQFNERFSSGTQVTVGDEPGGSGVTPGKDDQWYGFEQVFTCKLNNPKWSAGLRYEWVQDNQGSRVAGIGNILGTDKGWDGLPGFAGSFSDLSLGLNYRPHPNFVFRPEARWDWYAGAPNPAGQLPFGDLAHKSQFTVAMDLIVTF